MRGNLISCPARYWSNALKRLCWVLHQADVFNIISLIFYSANYEQGLVVGGGFCTLQTCRNVSLNRFGLKVHLAGVSKGITRQQMFVRAVFGCSVAKCFPPRRTGNPWSSLSEPWYLFPPKALPWFYSLPLKRGSHNTAECDPIAKQLEYLA